MAGNAKSEDYQIMLNGLKVYMNSLEDGRGRLMQATKDCNDAVDDDAGKICVEKMVRLCNDIGKVYGQTGALYKELFREYQQVLKQEEMLRRLRGLNN